MNILEQEHMSARRLELMDELNQLEDALGKCFHFCFEDSLGKETLNLNNDRCSDIVFICVIVLLLSQETQLLSLIITNHMAS